MRRAPVTRKPVCLQIAQQLVPLLADAAFRWNLSQGKVLDQALALLLLGEEWTYKRRKLPRYIRKDFTGPIYSTPNLTEDQIATLKRLAAQEPHVGPKKNKKKK